MRLTSGCYLGVLRRMNGAAEHPPGRSQYHDPLLQHYRHLGSGPLHRARDSDRLAAPEPHSEGKRRVNSILYTRVHSDFAQDPGPPPRWRLCSQSIDMAAAALKARVATRLAPPRRPLARATVRVTPPTPRPSIVVRRDLNPRLPKLYSWQRQALAAWRSAHSCGVVEAVTGTGKTMLAIAAAEEELRYGGKVLILTPTIELQHQWRTALVQHIPGAIVRCLGGGSHADFTTCDILVAIVNSARTKPISSPKQGALIIADECHRYGSRANSKALIGSFPRRLGLTATFERADYGHEKWLVPYFGSRVFEMTYRRALADGIIARFTVALVGVQFSPADSARYAELSTAIGRATKILTERYGLSVEPIGEFLQSVALLARRASFSPEGRVAAQFMGAFTERRQLLAEVPAKFSALSSLGSTIRNATSTLVFTETKNGAALAVQHLTRLGLRCAAIHSGISRSARHEMLENFRSGEIAVLAAPRVLDEGIDVPEADLGIIVAASQSRRQMIQRMGRVLRVKKDHGRGKFVVLFVEGTSEDPALGAHEAFLDELVDVADGIQVFRTGRAARSIKQDLASAKRPAGRDVQEKGQLTARCQ